MRVTHISSRDVSGGAARAAYRLHRGLRRTDVDSRMFVSTKRSADPDVFVFDPQKDLGARLLRKYRSERIAWSFSRYASTRPTGYELFTGDRCRHGRSPVDQMPEADVVNLHWVSGLIDYETFLCTVPRRTPVVWTLHDMNAFTGGCHYDMGCGKYTSVCQACPQLGSPKSADLANRVWRRKRRAFHAVTSSRLRFVAPSRWLANEAKRSMIGELFDISVIPYGLDLHDFSPHSRLEARRILKLPPDVNVILFVADDMRTRRKGFQLLAEALACMGKTDDLHLLAVGRGVLPDSLRIPVTQLGFLDHDRLLALVYSAADVFVVPSMQDNLPNTVLEAMACGTPSVGFAVGGLVDLIEPGVTGNLSPAFDVQEFARRILDLVRDRELRASMAARCRRNAERKYDLALQARRYAALYDAMVAENTTSAREPVDTRTSSGRPFMTPASAGGS